MILGLGVSHQPVNKALGIETAKAVPLVIGARTSLLVAPDWTDFDSHATIMLSLITEHGRATPLVWLTVNKAELKDRRSLMNAACRSVWPGPCR